MIEIRRTCFRLTNHILSGKKLAELLKCIYSDEIMEGGSEEYIDVLCRMSRNCPSPSNNSDPSTLGIGISIRDTRSGSEKLLLRLPKARLLEMLSDESESS